MGNLFSEHSLVDLFNKTLQVPLGTTDNSLEFQLQASEHVRQSPLGRRLWHVPDHCKTFMKVIHLKMPMLLELFFHHEQPCRQLEQIEWDYDVEKHFGQ